MRRGEKHFCFSPSNSHYHGGTALRDAVRKHCAGHEKVLRIELGLNPGETDLILREL